MDCDSQLIGLSGFLSKCLNGLEGSVIEDELVSVGNLSRLILSQGETDGCRCYRSTSLLSGQSCCDRVVLVIFDSEPPSLVS